MVSIGRGRGWAQNDKESLPRPGKTLHSEDTNYVNLLNIINLVNDENLEDKTKEVVQVTDEKVDKENLNDIHDKLYKHALSNKEFGLKLLMIYNCSAVKNIRDSENKTLLMHLLKCFQTDYERRKDLRQENVAQFHNAIYLFSKYLSSIPNRFPILQFALLDYMEMLLETTSEEDILMFTELIAVHGKNFHNKYKKKLDDLMIAVRQILIKENLSLTSRQMLLFTIDLESRNFKPLPKTLQKFYKLQLDKIFIQEDNDDDNSLSNTADEHNSSKNELIDQKYQSVPAIICGLRAIRGLGAADVAK